MKSNPRKKTSMLPIQLKMLMRGSKRKLQLPKEWKTLFAIPLILSFCVAADSCSKAPKFNWNPELWATDSQSQSIVHQKESGVIEIIPTSDQEFNKFICMDSGEIKKAQQAYFDVINECEKWKSSNAGRK